VVRSRKGCGQLYFSERDECRSRFCFRTFFRTYDFLGGLFGFAFGAMFGGTHNPADYENTPMRKQVLEGFKQSGKAGWSGMKNFAAVGGLYSLTECYLEQFRAKSDHWNTLMAGCFSGGLVAGRAGPHAAALGCATFAGFSYAIDYFLGRHHESTKVKHPDKYD